MRGLLGEGAPLSKSSIRRLRAGWTAEFEEWSQRRLEGREVVYVWADGIYVKAGLERDKAALLVVLGAMRDGTKEVLALRSGYRESVESCSEVLRDLKARGIEAPRLLMADGNAAIWGAVRQVWPEAGEQRCWNHKMRNVLDRLPQREQSEAKDLLRAVVYAPSRACAFRSRATSTVSCGSMPPGAQSTALTRTLIGLSSGHAARHASKTSSGKRMRPSRSPPHSSSRSFVRGEMNDARR